jgi:3-phosphoshikimate 1-carboxyvinyltransferase
MMRVVEPLALFGAGFETREGRLPLRIRGGHLAAIRYALPVPSAQVKSAILLAGAHATGTTVVEEPVPLRDHTEIALREAGARLRCGGGRVEIDGGVPLGARSIRIPADMSSASFFIAAALGLPDSEIVLPALGCNSGRRGFVDLLIRAGADIAFSSERDESGEPVGDAKACSSRIGCLEIDAAMVPALVDEIPVLAVLAAASGQGLEVRGAGELRHKETDRIHALVSNLTAVGVRVEELEDGLRLESSGIRGGVVSSFGDHRIAMAFAIGGLMSREGITIESPECVDISFPGFFPALEGVVER